jgi:hypothetical protein
MKYWLVFLYAFPRKTQEGSGILLRVIEISHNSSLVGQVTEFLRVRLGGWEVPHW